MNAIRHWALGAVLALGAFSCSQPTEPVDDPLTGRVFVRQVPESRLEFTQGEYRIDYFLNGNRARSVWGVYEVYESPKERWRIRGTVLLVQTEGNPTDARTPFDEELLLGQGVISLGGDVWREE